MNSLSLTDIQAFFNFLSSDAREIFTCTVMNADSSRVIQGYGAWFVNAQSVLAEFPRLHDAHEATLHVCLNQTGFGGRKLKDIQACRVLCVDLDRLVGKEELQSVISQYQVQMVVESSPQKYHLYWKVGTELGLEAWATSQRGLGHLFSGDTNLDQLNHNIRVPGVGRECKDGSPFLPSIVWLASECTKLDYDGILNLFPDILEHAHAAALEKKATRKKLGRVNVRGEDIRDAGKKGKRNDTLFQVLTGKVSKCEVLPDCPTVEQWAEEINTAFTEPMEDWEVEKVARSVFQSSESFFAEREVRNAEQLTLLTPALEESASPCASPESVIHTANGHGPRNGEITGYEGFSYDLSTPMLCDSPYTEQGLAARVVQRFGDSLLRVGKQFYAFNAQKRIWKVQDSEAHTELIEFTQTCARDIIHEEGFKTLFCKGAGGKVSAAKTRAAIDKFMSIRLHTQTARLVKQFPGVTEETSDIFDAKEHMFHCANGVLNIRTGELRQATGSDYLLAQADVNWNGEAKCEWWLGFLGELFEGSTDTQAMTAFMQELFGYSISGSISEQVLFLHSGDGCNGKSKVLSALNAICGAYGTYTDPDELVRSKTGFVRATERFGAKIEGKRVAIIDDIDVKTNWNENFVRAVTAPVIRARAEHEKSRVISNRCVLHLGLNVAPSPDAENYGLLRRMCIIPYNVRFKPDANISRQIDSKIKEEQEGILKWAVEGYQRRAMRGVLEYPAELTATVEEYRQDHFTLETTVEELFEAPLNEEEGTWEYLTTLTQDVNNHLRQSGESRQISVDELGIAFKRKLHLKVKKVWDSDRKNAYKAALVKLKFERTNKQTLLNRM